METIELTEDELDQLVTLDDNLIFEQEIHRIIMQFFKDNEWTDDTET